MDFYKFVFSFASLEKLVTTIYPYIISEFEKRFNVSVEESSIDILYNPIKSIHEIRIIIRCKKGKFYIPIASLKESPTIYGIEYAFKNMIPSFPE